MEAEQESIGWKETGELPIETNHNKIRLRRENHAESIVFSPMREHI